MEKVTNITVAGLGGQGVLKVTDILAEVLFAAGYDVKKSEAPSQATSRSAKTPQKNLVAVFTSRPLPGLRGNVVQPTIPDGRYSSKVIRKAAELTSGFLSVSVPPCQTMSQGVALCVWSSRIADAFLAASIPLTSTASVWPLPR